MVRRSRHDRLCSPINVMSGAIRMEQHQTQRAKKGDSQRGLSCASSCSSDYDSEEDRLKARRSNLQQRSHHRRHAQQQQEILYRYRQQIKVEALLKQCYWLPESQSVEDKQSRPLDIGTAWHQRPASSLAQKSSHTQACAAHEKRWTELEGGKKLSSFEDIPWPPSQTGIIAAIALHHKSTRGCPEQGRNIGHEKRKSEIWRKTYKQALLRWHPDKMSARLSGLQDQTQRDAAMQHVHQIMHSIHQEWEQLLQPGHL